MNKDIALHRSPHKWTKQQIVFLKHNYPLQGKYWCCEALGLKEHQIRYKVSSLNLTLDKTSEFYKTILANASARGKSKKGLKRPEHGQIIKTLWAEGRFPPRKRKTRICTICGGKFTCMKKARKTCSATCHKNAMKTRWQRSPHPKGFIGKTRTQEERRKLSEQSKKMWSDPNHRVNSDAHRQAISDRMAGRVSLSSHETYSRCKRGWVEFGNKRYFMRSKWEMNYAAYLEWLKDRGEIVDWLYEVETFWFEKIRRGVRSYTPDFQIQNKDGSIEYHEVKGWMDKKSQTKLKRMAKYHPHVCLKLVDEDAYKGIAKWSRLIPHWID